MLFSAISYNMKENLRKIIFGTLALLPYAAYAQYYGQNTIPNPLGAGTSISVLISNIVDFIFSLGLALAVVVFLIGGFQYLFSFGSERKVEQAHKTLWWGVVGAIIMLTGRGITAIITSIIS